jgi:Holliday junction resolvasome RuvABC endonuclease subunit
MVKILAFDISSVSTGVAFFNDGKLVKSSLTLIQPNPRAKNYGERLVYFQDNLRSLIQLHKPDTVAIEDIFKGRNMSTFKSLAMFRGVAIKTIFEEMKKDPVGLSASETRSTLEIGSSKEEAYAAMVEKYSLADFNFEEHNDIVDAIALGLAIDTLLKQGTNERSLQRTRRKKRRKRTGNKKGV